MHALEATFDEDEVRAYCIGHACSDDKPSDSKREHCVLQHPPPKQASIFQQSTTLTGRLVGPFHLR